MSTLYMQHFGLTKPPFKITPDLDFFFSGGRRGDILSALLHVARHEEGIITVVAEVGSGKTLLSRLMISQLGPQVSTVYLANPCFSRDEILSAIARDLGLTDLPVSTEAKLSVLQQELLRRHAGGQRVLLVVDEAHAMPPESLEEIRLLSNLETASHKLVNIMLFGQPELDTLLADPRLRQVRDRVIHRFELQPLPLAEACAYVDHRLRAAGWKGGALFSKAALALLVKASAGRARRINLLADKSLLGAYAEGVTTVDARHVKDALGELHSDGPAQNKATAWLSMAKWGLSSVALAVTMTIVALWWMVQHRPMAQIASFNTPAPLPQKASVPSPATPAVSASVSAPRVLPKAPAAKPSKEFLAEVRNSEFPVTDAGLQEYLTRTQTQIAKPGLGGFTIQLAALPRDASVVGYFKLASRHLDSARIFAQLSTYNGRNFVSVYFGDFLSVTEASVALAGLPISLKTNKPIVRTWVKIRQDQTL